MTEPGKEGPSARDRALRFLEARDRSRREVELRLRRANEAEEDVQDVIQWLTRLGYLDDRRFAITLAREKIRDAWGPHRIRAELARKGVDRIIVEEIVGEGYEAEVYRDVAGGVEGAEEQLVRLVSRRFGKEWERDPEKAQNKVSGFLARRGHDWELINSVLRRIAADNEPGRGDTEAPMEP